jgi:hypothetical protein
MASRNPLTDETGDNPYTWQAVKAGGSGKERKVSEFSYGLLMTIRPVPEPGTRVKIISGMWQGKKGVYMGKRQGLLGSLYEVKLEPGDVPTVLLAQSDCMQYES